MSTEQLKDEVSRLNTLADTLVYKLAAANEEIKQLTTSKFKIKEVLSMGESHAKVLMIKRVYSTDDGVVVEVIHEH